jgi:hypothetical protein
MTSQNVRICFNFLSFIFFNLKINFKYKKRELRNSEGSESDIFRVSYGTIFVKKIRYPKLGSVKKVLRVLDKKKKKNINFKLNQSSVSLQLLIKGF